MKHFPQQLVIVVVFFLCLQGLTAICASAQVLERFAFKTNLIEVGAAIPNLSVMADVSAKPWNRSAAGITVKYKWKTSQSHQPLLELNLLEVRPEYRYYLKNLYLGGYGAYSTFTTRLPEHPEGWSGQAFGGGASAGFEKNLYLYRKGAIDIDLGLSLGVHYIRYSQGTGPVVLPYPELRAALTWRRTSVQEKYRGTDPMKNVYAREKESIDISYNATNRESFDALRQQKLKTGQTSILKDLYGGDREAYLADYKAYFQESFVDLATEGLEQSTLDSKNKDKLKKYIRKLEKKALDAFEKEIKAEN